MTDKRYLYEQLTAGHATVVAQGTDGDRPWVRLDRTWFHPQGGGQQSDRGTIGGVPVTQACHAEGDDVVHFLADGESLQIGQTVEVVVDRQWRQTCARLHTAGHLIAAVTEDLFPPLKATAGHHWPGEARVEFAGEPQPESGTLQPHLQAAVTEAIGRSLSITMHGDPLRSRTIQIGQYPAMGCGGTHLDSLSELSQVQIRSVKAKGGRLRVGYDVV